MPKYDLDALLGEPLELVLGGKSYILNDLPIRTVMDLAKENVEDDPWRFLRLVLGPAGMTEDDLVALDQRKALAATRLITAHFTQLPKEMTEAIPALAEAGQELTGATPSPDSSGSSPATG